MEKRTGEIGHKRITQGNNERTISQSAQEWGSRGGERREKCWREVSFDMASEKALKIT